MKSCQWPRKSGAKAKIILTSPGEIKAPNNVAEYEAFLASLWIAKKCMPKNLNKKLFAVGSKPGYPNVHH